jgi:hypothetical protein
MKMTAQETSSQEVGVVEEDITLGLFKSNLNSEILFKFFLREGSDYGQSSEGVRRFVLESVRWERDSASSA